MLFRLIVAHGHAGGFGGALQPHGRDASSMCAPEQSPEQDPEHRAATPTLCRDPDVSAFTPTHVQSHRQ